MLLSLSLLNVFETTLQGGIVTKQLLTSFPVWNGMEQRKGRILHILHMRSARGVHREMREYAERVYREMQRKFTKGVYGQHRGSLQRNAEEDDLYTVYPTTAIHDNVAS